MDREMHIGDATAPLLPSLRGRFDVPRDPIQRVLQQITTGADVGRVLEGIARLWSHSSRHFPYCAVTLASSGADRLWVAAATGLPPAFRGLMWETGPATRPSFFTRETESLIEDMEKHPQVEGDLAMLLGMGICACWRLPVMGKDGRLLGALIACAPEPAIPNDDERAFIGRLVHLVRIVVEKSRIENEVVQLSHFDELTGLPNRNHVLERLEHALARGRRRESRTALLLLNLDGLSRINESLGYAIGDEVIKAVARRLSEPLGKGQTLARFGGDEFAVLVEGVPGEAALTGLARTLLGCITRPLRVAEQEMFVTASLGAALASGGEKDASVLFRHADAALRRAKARGGNSSRLYAPDMDTSAGRVALLGDLCRALERSEFQVQYQPQLDLHGGGLAGAEALIRWRHPQRGLVPPVEFIPLLEETGLILPVGEWLFRQVCADIASLTDEAQEVPRIAVNLSLRQFHQEDLAERIEGMLKDSGVDGSRLGVELTESLMMQEPELTTGCLRRMKGAGIAVAVDDFGIGYSSFAYLKRFPVDVLKLDKSFVDGVCEGGPDAAIVEAIIRMAHSLGMKTVAEGVETEPQRSFLRQHSCDLLQGYLYSPPLDFDAFRGFLAAQAPARTVQLPGNHPERMI